MCTLHLFLISANSTKLSVTKAKPRALFYKYTLGRDDRNLKDHGATINARMGLNSWATGNDADAPLPDKHQN